MKPIAKVIHSNYWNTIQDKIIFLLSYIKFVIKRLIVNLKDF